MSDFLEILYDNAQECPRRMTVVKIGTGSRILPPEGWYWISFWGYISAHDYDIFTKFGGCVDTMGSPKCGMLQIRFLRKSNLADGGHIPHT